MNDFPLVSILINNYNYGQFLRDAIDSALNQTYSNVEIIVVDDGSTDNSRSIIEGYGDKILPIFKNNGGQASAFNSGFNASKGEIICFLDADDSFQSNKIETIVEIFKTTSNDVNWCFHPLEYINQSTKEIISMACTGNSARYDLREPMSRGKLSGKLPLGTATSGTCFKRLFLQKILPMPEEIRITSDDYIKYIALGSSPGFISFEKLAKQRIHDNNAYTFKPDQLFLIAKTQILTAYWMRENHPHMAEFSNSLMALGIGLYWKHKEVDFGCKELIQDYLFSSTYLERLRIYAKALYYRVK